MKLNRSSPVTRRGNLAHWKRALLMGTALTGFSAGASAALADETWQGTASSDWNNAANWVSAVPTAGDEVFILDVSGNPVDIGAGVNAVVTKVTVSSAAAATDMLTVSGGGTLSADNIITGLGDYGVLDINTTGKVTTATGFIGFLAGSTGTVTVDGADSLWTVNGSLFTGYAGTGNLIIRNDGDVTATSLSAGFTTYGDGTITVTGGGSSLDVTNAISLGGLDAHGQMNVLAGGVVASDTGRLGFIAGGIGTATVDGSGSNWETAHDLYVGDVATGLLYITNGGRVRSYANTYIGNTATGGGTVTISGGGEMQADSTVVIGTNGNGTLTLGDGTLTALVQISIGEQTGSVGVLNIGADQWSAPAAAGTITSPHIFLGFGDSHLVLNHTETAYYLNSNLSSATGNNHTIEQMAGHTIYTGNGAAFSGVTNITGGTLSVDGSLGANINVLGGVLGGHGTVGVVNVASGGTLAPGNSIGTLSMTAADFAAGSIYSVEVDSSGNSDLLHASHYVSIDNGASVFVAPANGTDDGSTYALSTTYTIITADGGVTGTFGSVADSFAFLNPTLTYDANNVYLTLLQGSDFASAGMTPNQIAAGTGADSLGITNPLTNALVMVNSASAPAALDAISGEMHASLKGRMVQDASYVREATFARLGNAADALDFRSSINAYAPGGSPSDSSDNAAWGHAYGGVDRADGDGNAADANSAAGGVVGGIDGVVGNWRLGFLLDAGHTNFAVPDRDSSGDSVDFGLGLYGGTVMGNTRFDFGAAYTRHSISTRRDVRFPGFSERLKADYDAGTAQIFGRISQAFDVGQTELSPFAELAYVDHQSDAFTETGGSAALSSSGSRYGATFTTLGFDMKSQVNLTPEMPATFTGTLGWQHAFADLPDAVNAFAGGTPFTVTGTPVASDMLVVKAGLDFDVTAGTSVGLNYAGQIASGQQSHHVGASLNVRF